MLATEYKIVHELPKEYSDMDIARLMKISHKTVAYRKQMAMKKLRLLLEGMEYGH